jgi:DNA-binding NarL/FixJ family response regulator
MLAGALADVHGLEIVGQAGSGEDIEAGIEETRPDVLLLDINLPDRSGLEVLKSIKMLDPELRVIILTGYPLDEHIFTALQRGADGFLSKNTSIDKVRDAVQAVYGGGSFLDPQATTKLVREFLKGAAGRGEAGKGENGKFRMTPREAEILKLLAKGLNNKEIAASIHVSENTIKRHLSNLFKKLKVRDRIQAIFFAQEKGLM